MFENVIDTLVGISEKTGIPEIARSASLAKKNVTDGALPNIVFVSDQFGKKELFRIASLLCQTEVNPDGVPEDGSPVHVTVRRGSSGALSEESLCADPSSEPVSVAAVDCGLQSKALKGFTAELYCGVDLKAVGSNVFDRADYLFLLTNATMSLPMKEKEWIREKVAALFDCDRFAVVLYNANLLNTDEDVESVCENIRLITGRINGAIAFCPTGEDAVALAESVVRAPADYRKKRQAAALRSCVDYSAGLIERRMEAQNIDIDKLRETVENVENEKSGIEISGKVAVENVVERLYNDLRYELVNAAGERNNEIYSKISRDILATDNLSAELTNVQQYMENSWNRFETEAQARIGEENKKITEELAAQIETDCGKLLEMVDIPGIESFLSGTKYKIEFGELKKNAENSKKQKNISRGVLAASIGLAVLGYPILGISAFVGSKIYQHFYGKSAPDQDVTRQETLASIKRGCDEIMTGIITRTGKAIDTAKAQAKDSVIKAYSEVMSSLVDSISQAAEKIEAAQNNVAALEESSAALKALRREL